MTSANHAMSSLGPGLHSLFPELHTYILQYLLPHEIPLYLSLSERLSYETPICWKYLLEVHFPEYRHCFRPAEGQNPSTSAQIPVKSQISSIPFHVQYWCFYFHKIYYSPKCNDWWMNWYECRRQEIGVQDRLIATNSYDPAKNSLIKLHIFRNMSLLDELKHEGHRAHRAVLFFITVMQKYPTLIPQFDTKTLKMLLRCLYEHRSARSDALIERITKFVVARAKTVNSHHEEDDDNPLRDIHGDVIPYYTLAMTLSKHDFVGIPAWRRVKRASPMKRMKQHQHVSAVGESYTCFAELGSDESEEDVGDDMALLYHNRSTDLGMSVFQLPVVNHDIDARASEHGNDDSQEETQSEAEAKHAADILNASHSIQERLEENRKIRLVQSMSWHEFFGETMHTRGSTMGTFLIMSQYIFIKHMLKKSAFDFYTPNGVNQVWWTSVPLLFAVLYFFLHWIHNHSDSHMHPLRMLACIILGTAWAFVVHIQHFLLDTILFSATLAVDTILPFVLLYRFGSYTMQPYHLFHPLGLIWIRIFMLAIGIVIQSIPTPPFIAEFLKSEGTLVPLLTIELCQYILCIRPLRMRLIQSLRSHFPESRRVSFLLMYIEACREQSGGMSADNVAVWMGLLLVMHLLYGLLYLFLHVFSFSAYMDPGSEIA